MIGKLYYKLIFLINIDRFNDLRLKLNEGVYLCGINYYKTTLFLCWTFKWELIKSYLFKFNDFVFKYSFCHVYNTITYYLIALFTL